MFDPMRDIPTTDDEAKIALKAGKDDLVGRNLVGIFECQRLRGGSVIDAYQYALETALEVMEPEMYQRLKDKGAVGKIKQ